MAAILFSNVTKLRSFMTMDAGGAQVEKVSDVAIVLAAQGGVVGDIPAATLGFAKLYTALPISLDVAGVISAPQVAISADGSELITADATGVRAGLTGTLNVRLTGVPK